MGEGMVCANHDSNKQLIFIKSLERASPASKGFTCLTSILKAALCVGTIMIPPFTDEENDSPNISGLGQIYPAS